MTLVGAGLFGLVWGWMAYAATSSGAWRAVAAVACAGALALVTAGWMGGFGSALAAAAGFALGFSLHTAWRGALQRKVRHNR